MRCNNDKLCVKKVELFSGYLRQKKIREEKLGVEKFEWTMSIRSPTKVAPTEWGSESVTNLLPGEVLEMLRSGIDKSLALERKIESRKRDIWRQMKEVIFMICGSF